jgi:DNA-3-methyladenine glycosylase II
MLKSTYSGSGRGRSRVHACQDVVVEAPFSLELTVLVLRRVATNIVDQWADGSWLRALPESEGVLRVRQVAAQTLRIEPAAGVPVVRRVLGLDVSPALLRQVVAGEPRLRAVAERCAGLRPPRFPTLFEAIGMTIPFQQVSLPAGQSICNQLVRRFGTPVGPGWRFPTPGAIAAASPDDLRACGLSSTKARTFQVVARLVLDGQLSEDALGRLPSAQLLATLDAVPGIGPWTAAVIALRGLGRLDVFPRADVGARRSLARLLGQSSPLTEAQETELLDRLGPSRGLAYFLALAATRAPA